MRRAILERFRADHGDKPIAPLPPKFIAVMLPEDEAIAARNWLKTIRHLMQFCVAQEICAGRPDARDQAPARQI